MGFMGAAGQSPPVNQSWVFFHETRTAAGCKGAILAWKACIA